jgi:sugar/nucleoside kinase (ribokinase family)
MSLLVVGSVGLDTVRTPFGAVEEALGGSATYCSAAASFFTPVLLVAVVGEDFPEEHVRFLEERRVDLRGLQRTPGRTFRWRGEYTFELNEAKTLDTQLNVFDRFRPDLPEAYRQAEFLFLANIDPDLQRDVLRQMRRPRLVACDTMNFWIEGKLEALRQTIREVDLLVINEGEARELAREPNLMKAARQILSLGPKALIVKRGEYGACLFNGKQVFAAPAYPLESVFDPTGAGDAFAGGMMGYLAASGDLSDAGIRRAMIFGSVLASFNVEDFSLNRLRTLCRGEIDQRYREFLELTRFEEAHGGPQG